MTPDTVDDALTEYLATGEDSAIAGLARESGSCPVARACRARWHHLYTVNWFGIYPVAACGYLAKPSPRLEAFIRAVDDSCRARVTFAEARALWGAE